ncbi:MAG: RNA polymerase sigma factor [bacterium]|nr:RNA polymerase sigma factor [bacterium]
MSHAIPSSAAPEIANIDRHAAPVLSFATGRPIDPAVAERRRQDRELVNAILAGEADAFTRLHELYSRRIYRFAAKRLGDAAEAEDVVQDVFLEVFRCVGSWEGRSALLTWMFGIAHHQLCRRFRKKTPVGVPIEKIEAVAPVPPEASSDRRVEASRILGVCADVLDEGVSPAQREIFDLYYGENRPTRAIAGELGKSNQAVKISLFRTRRAMEARLEELEMVMIA